MNLSSPDHFKALAHPTRQRILFKLGEPATISQLAHSLDTHKGNVAHHLKVLEDAGLVELRSTRQVRGGTERYFARTARMMTTVGDASQANLAVSFEAIAAEIADAAPDPLLILRHLRLTRAQVDAITAMLNDLGHNTEEADADQPRYGMLLGLFETRSG